MRTLFFAALSVALAACSPPQRMPVDAGPDTSCGLDCVAQEEFGLIVNRCFEYSADPLAPEVLQPSLGVWVREVFELEGGIKTLPVEYRRGGQTIGIDYFAFVNGNLTLMRRIAANSSVTYRSDGAITGVTWLPLGAGAGQNFSTTRDAFLSSNNTSTSTVYRVTTQEASTAEKRNPAGVDATTGFTMIFGETPDHGSDSRRVFVPGTGFIVITSPFNLAGNPSSVPNHLQRIRDIGTADAGSEGCSLGVP
ncbi:MAG: hypothetical protein ACO1OB_27710 [Archangium sp.]